LLLALLALLVPALAAPCAVLDAPPPADGCLTLALFDAARQGAPSTCPDAWGASGLGPRSRLPPGTGLPTRADKLVRDSISPNFNVYETPNFAVKWGNLTGFTEADAQSLGADFEAAWQAETNTFGYPTPPTTDTYKLNVYVGDSGAGAPTSLGSAGYYFYDHDGYPMIVVAADVLPDHDLSALTSAHELFHGVQDSEGYFDWDGTTSDWYGEATAIWMEGQVYPDDSGYAAFLYWFAIRPELSLDYYKYPQSGDPEEYHQYGAFVFIDHLSQNVEDPSLIQRSFEAGYSGADALDLLDGLIAADGGSLRDAFADFVGRNGTWDYDNGAWYRQWIDAYGGYDTGNSHRPSGYLHGDSDWIQPTEDLPHGWGANYWGLNGFTGDAVLHFDGTVDPTRVPDRWIATVAVRAGDTHRRYPLALVDGQGTLAAADVGAYDEAWLVVAPLAARGTQTWPYAVRMEVPPHDTADTGQTPRSCGCRAGPGGAALWWVLLPWLVRRRRADQPCRSQVATSVA